MPRRRKGKGDLASVQQPAPGDLRLVHAFVNTLDRRKGTEDLASPRALRAWLSGQGLPGTEKAFSKKDLRKAIEVREGLRALLAAQSGFGFDQEAVARLGELTAAGRYEVRLAGDGTARFHQVNQGLDAALARLMEIVVFAQIGGEWPRLKACASPDCRAAFYDHSNNRSGKWCSNRRCGNQKAVRKYRRSDWYKSLHADDGDDWFR